MSSPISTLPSITYEAHWPKELDPALKNVLTKIARLFWNIISVIIFPIGLVRLVSRALRDGALRIIVPGNVEVVCNVMGKSLLKNFSGHPLTLTSPDNTLLDGAFFPGKIRKKAIIYAFGNAHQWENCSQRLEQLKPLNTSILVINPRGVGKSEGTRSEEGYALDIYAAYDFLIKKEKIDPNDIVFVGFSMGAAYGTCGAALVQEEYPDKEIKAINIKSFSDLQLELQTILAGRGILGAIARITAKILAFSLYPKQGWDTLKGKKCIFYDPSDEVIPKPASLFKAVKDHPVGTTEVVKLHPRGHNAYFVEDELNTFQNTILDYLKIDRSQTDLPQAFFWNPFSTKIPTLRSKTITQLP
jgi:hypothetical protein